MADYPTENEMLVIFGDGSIATLWDVLKDNKKGEYIFFFKPTPHMAWKNQIPDDEADPSTGIIKKPYPMELCMCIDHSPQFQRWILFCDYYKNPCDLAEMLNQELLAKVKVYKEERNVWEMQAILSPLRMKKAIKHPEEQRTAVLEEFKKQKTIMAADYLTEGQKEKGGGDKGGE